MKRDRKIPKRWNKRLFGQSKAGENCRKMVISSLVENPKPEMGLSDKGDMQNVQCWGHSRNMVENH